jgi:hypothetical protein
MMAIMLNLTIISDLQDGFRSGRFSAGRLTSSGFPNSLARLSARSRAPSPMKLSTYRAPTLTDQIGGLRLVSITLTS